MNQGVKIRPYRFPDDYESVVALWENSGPGVRTGRSDTLEEIAKKQERDPELFLVAEIDESIIGTVLGGFDGRRALIYHLSVDENFANRGLALP